MTVDHKIVKILLVEDNLDHIEITKEALQQAGVINELFIVRDGNEAIDFLERKGKYQDSKEAFKPGLILLDINLPKKNGLEVLKKLKTDPDLKRIPTILLTVSKRDEDVVKGYNYGCNSYIQKPVEFEKFVAVVKQIGLYWGLLNINSPNSSGE
ncbi:MAG: response regulator [Candidatus Omnitrophica bacterium]|nr:response regulator [Candidatus Omnitrophota bacterium]